MKFTSHAVMMALNFAREEYCDKQKGSLGRKVLFPSPAVHHYNGTVRVKCVSFHTNHYLTSTSKVLTDGMFTLHEICMETYSLIT